MLKNKRTLKGKELDQFINREGLSVIYFLKRDSEVVYVGQTIDIVNRIRNHAESKEFDEVEYHQVDKEKIDFVESYYIIKHSPNLNKDMPIKPEHMGLVREKDLPGFVSEKDRRFVIKSRGIKYYDINNLIEKMKKELDNEQV